MTKAKTESERVRKAYAPRGQRSQKRVTFLLDNDLVPLLEQQHNKGRFINNCIRKSEGQ